MCNIFIHTNLHIRLIFDLLAVFIEWISKNQPVIDSGGSIFAVSFFLFLFDQTRSISYFYIYSEIKYHD